MSQHISLRLKKKDGITVEELDRKAEELGINRTDLIVLGIQIIYKLDNVIIEDLENLASHINADLPSVVRNTVIGQIARRLAEINTQGGTHVMLEFPHGKEGLMSGKELFDFLYKTHVKRLKMKEAAENWLADEREAASSERDNRTQDIKSTRK